MKNPFDDPESLKKLNEVVAKRNQQSFDVISRALQGQAPTQAEADEAEKLDNEGRALISKLFGLDEEDEK